uniref:FAD-binding domain-containing protein n=1 Tax=Heliothis virescens TaxID=7102 RepID=A0A2A4IZL9_HELVI
MFSNNVKRLLVQHIKCSIRTTSVRCLSAAEDVASLSSKPNTNYKGDYDVIIAGGGMVGCSLACALAKDSLLSHLKVLLLEGGPNKNFELKPEYSNRVVALNQNTKALMTSLDVWRHVESMRLQPVKHMQVWDACSDVMIAFNSEELLDDDVAYIVENDVMLHAINKELSTAKKENTNIVYNAKIAGYQLPHQDDLKPMTCVEMANGDIYTCKLLFVQ